MRQTLLVVDQHVAKIDNRQIYRLFCDSLMYNNSQCHIKYEFVTPQS